MFRRKSQDHKGVKYHSLKRRKNTEDEFIDTQFELSRHKIPWKALCLAVFLCVGGTLLLTVGILIVFGHLDDKYADRMWPVIIIGMIMFLPGAYHVYIAYCAFRRYPGYSFDDIPEFD